MRRALFGLLSFMVVGCGGRQETPSPTSPTAPTAAHATTAATPGAAVTAAGAATAPYEVHEWGLLRAGAGDVLEAGAISPPGVYAEPMAVDKPVLYFHASGPVQLEEVRVEAIGGTIREHWPLTAATGFPTSIVWRGLALDAAHSAGGAGCSGAFPAVSARPCSDLPRGEECESKGLAAVLATSATCLRSGETRLPFLFYRSRTSTFTPPLQVSGLPSGELRLTNTGDAPIPGWIVRMRRSSGGQVRTIAVRAPGARATVTLGVDFANAAVPVADIPPSDEEQRASDAPAMPGSQEPGRQAVRITLDQLGLDGTEADAFLRAWDETLFGERIVPLLDRPRRSAGASDRRGAIDVLTADDGVTDESFLASSDTLLYFLPPAACDQVARLQFTPAPVRVNRALAVWQPAR